MQPSRIQSTNKVRIARKSKKAKHLRSNKVMRILAKMPLMMFCTNRNLEEEREKGRRKEGMRRKRAAGRSIDTTGVM